jgi:proline dehydrogenase
MLRSFFVSLSKATWAQRMISRWGVARRAASRFVAGENSSDAIQVVRQLNQRHIQASLNHLGETTNRPEDAALATREICDLLTQVNENGLHSNVSIKLTQIGLSLDKKLCHSNLLTILYRARELGNFVRIDMEDSSYVGRTLELYSAVRAEGYDNVGIVLQSYLYRSQTDLARMMENCGKVRLVKGAYQEPANVAFPQKADVDQNYDLLALQLLRGAQRCGCPPLGMDGKFPPIPAFGTHDPARIDFIRLAVDELKIPHECIEFQMIYGVRRDIQQMMADQGYNVRVYIPYGSHWYPYLMRRLGERPANAWFFLSNLFRR